MDNEISGIQDKILIIRNQQVMLDRDIAELYGVETKRLNEQVRRNISRFPEQFMFQLTKSEVDDISRSQFVTLKIEDKTQKDFSRSQFATLKTEDDMRGKNIKYLPYAFTEQGVAMLSSVLRSETAIQVSIRIMDAFVSMRKFLLANAQVFQRLNNLELHQLQSDKRINEIFSLMDKYKIDETQGVFFQGQIFEAYRKFESFIIQAKKDIILIDNYIDLSVLECLSKKNKGVNVTIYSDSKTKLTSLDISKFNAQYPTLTVKYTNKMHDRFLIIDRNILYHIGASLKDLGKKCFGFAVLNPSLIPSILQNI